MSHTRIVMAYSGLMFGFAALTGGYVACGAQSYRVPVHGDIASDPSQPSNIKTSGDTSMNGASLLGIHSRAGWSRTGPVQFYTSSQMSEEAVRQLEKAMETWEKAVGRDLFTYKGREERSGADFSSLYEPLDDSVNGHYFDFKWTEATGKSPAVLATTIWENDPNDEQSIVKADIRYNAEYYLFGDALTEFSSGRRTIVDLESLALHELGHLLGLSHIGADEDKYSVMNPSLFIGEGMMTRNLSYGDIERIRSVYGIGDPSAVENLEIADDQQQTGVRNTAGQ